MPETLKDLLPFVSALGVLATAIFGVRTYKVQENPKRETALAQRKEELYEKLVRSLVDLLVAKTPAHRSRLTTEIEKGWLFASDQVLEASYDYINAFDRVCSPPRETEPFSVEAPLIHRTICGSQWIPALTRYSSTQSRIICG